MGTGFFFPTKAAVTTQWVPLKQPVFPAGEPVDYPEQLVGQTSGGSVYVQDKGAKRETFTLHFDRISAGDRSSALVFFNTVKKAFNTFEYEDRNGTLHKVRWMNEFDFRFVQGNRHSGTVQLRKE